MNQQQNRSINQAACAAPKEALLTLRQTILRLHEIGAISFGDFTLKSGITSPIYIDFRRLITDPVLLKSFAALLWECAQAKQFDLICGVPYGALAIACSVGVLYNRPMIMPRKAVKDHGTGRVIEGVFKKGQTVVLFEDLITSGASTLEVVSMLRAQGLVVNDVMILLDREQGGKARIENENISVTSLFSMTTMLEVLQSEGKVDVHTTQKVFNFISENQF